MCGFFFFKSTYDIFADCLIARISQSIMTLNESKHAMLEVLCSGFSTLKQPRLPASYPQQIKTGQLGELVPLSLGSNPYLINYVS